MSADNKKNSGSSGNKFTRLFSYLKQKCGFRSTTIHITKVKSTVSSASIANQNASTSDCNNLPSSTDVLLKEDSLSKSSTSLHPPTPSNSSNFRNELNAKLKAGGAQPGRRPVRSFVSPSSPNVAAGDNNQSTDKPSFQLPTSQLGTMNGDPNGVESSDSYMRCALQRVTLNQQRRHRAPTRPIASSLLMSQSMSPSKISSNGSTSLRNTTENDSDLIKTRVQLQTSNRDHSDQSATSFTDRSISSSSDTSSEETSDSSVTDYEDDDNDRNKNIYRNEQRSSNNYRSHRF